MPELNKAVPVEGLDVVAFSNCLCVCICLIFTQRRHEDLLAAGHAVANN